jgi:hypothetical protein
MSYYYNYYLGYKKNNKIYPLGPYDFNGDFIPVISKSRTYASDLYKMFDNLFEEEVSDELRKEFNYESYERITNIKYLNVKDLPTESYIKQGYFLIKDVEAYNKKINFEGFYDIISPEIYAVKLQHEILFGKNQPIKDIEGYEYTEPNASDYMYYMYPDYDSKEFESFLLKTYLEPYQNYIYDNEIEYVILEVEG